jgi:metallophosphoesterase superfamily enzyme
MEVKIFKHFPQQIEQEKLKQHFATHNHPSMSTNVEVIMFDEQSYCLMNSHTVSSLYFKSIKTCYYSEKK